MLLYESRRTVVWFISGLISMIFIVMALATFLVVSGIVWLIGHEEMEEIHLSELDSSYMRFVLWDVLMLGTALIIGATFAFHIYLMNLPRNAELQFYMARDSMGLRLLRLMLGLQIAFVLGVFVFFEL